MASQDYIPDENSDLRPDSPTCGNQTWKRKHLQNNSDLPQSRDVLKKARYSWQVKGHSNRNTKLDVDEKSLDSIVTSLSYQHIPSEDLSKNRPYTSLHPEGSGQYKPESDNEEDSSYNNLRTVSNTTDSVSTVHYSPTRTDTAAAKDTPQTKEKVKDSAILEVDRINEDNTNPSPVTSVDSPTTASSLLESNFPSERESLLNFQGSNDSTNQVQSGQRVDHLKRWQALNTAGAVVDNVLNKTLEEMGLSPNRLQDSASTHNEVENLSILEAIERQGLVLNSNYEMAFLKNDSGTIPSFSPEVREELIDRVVSELESPRAEANVSFESGADSQGIDKKVESSVSHTICTEGMSEDLCSNERVHSCENNNTSNQPTDSHSHLLSCNINQADDSSVLDLAVSTAIFTTGLSIKRVQDS